MLKKTPELTKIHLWWNMVPGVQNVRISLCTSSAEDVTCWLMTSPFIVNVNLQLSIATPKVQPKVWLAHLASSTQDWATNWTSSKQLNKLHTFATSSTSNWDDWKTGQVGAATCLHVKISQIHAPSMVTVHDTSILLHSLFLQLTTHACFDDFCVPTAQQQLNRLHTFATSNRREMIERPDKLE